MTGVVAATTVVSRHRQYPEGLVGVPIAGSEGPGAESTDAAVSQLSREIESVADAAFSSGVH